MVPLSALLVPIVVAAVLVHLASAVVHMVLQWHRTDCQRLPDEDSVRAALRKSPPAPGQYMFPYHADMKEFKTPEYQKKFEEGPVGMLTMRPSGKYSMTAPLIQWFIVCLVISTFAAYVAGAALPPGTDYLKVFQVAGTVAFASYGLGTLSQSVWMGKPWSSTMKDLADSLLYGCLTGGAMGWRWPHAM
jgi:hypothetical protein